MTWIGEIVADTTMMVMSVAVGTVVGNLVVRSLTGRVTVQAAAAATEAQAAYSAKKIAGENLKSAILRKEGEAATTLALKQANTAANKAFLEGAAKVVPPSAWIKFGAFFRRFPRATGGVAAIVASIIAGLLIDLVWDKINKDFWIQVQIYNFDKKTWKVDSWHHDNGIIAGNVPFTAESMPALSDGLFNSQQYKCLDRLSALCRYDYVSMETGSPRHARSEWRYLHFSE